MDLSLYCLQSDADRLEMVEKVVPDVIRVTRKDDSVNFVSISYKGNGIFVSKDNKYDLSDFCFVDISDKSRIHVDNNSDLRYADSIVKKSLKEILDNRFLYKNQLS